jgi:hypothetical protein
MGEAVLQSMVNTTQTRTQRWGWRNHSPPIKRACWTTDTQVAPHAATAAPRDALATVPAAMHLLRSHGLPPRSVPSPLGALLAHVGAPHWRLPRPVPPLGLSALHAARRPCIQCTWRLACLRCARAAAVLCPRLLAQTRARRPRPRQLVLLGHHPLRYSRPAWPRLQCR